MEVIIMNAKKTDKKRKVLRKIRKKTMGRLKLPEEKKESPIRITEHTIEAMAQAGMTQREIAAAFQVGDKILRKYYPMEGLFRCGQPRRVFNYEILSEAAGVGCTDSELAVLMGLEISSHLKYCQADAQYREAIKTGREKAKKELRKLRYRLALGERDPVTGKWIEKPNTAMIFRLSRELLGERDFNGATAVERKEEIVHKFDFTNMTLDELKEIKNTICKLKEKGKSTNSGKVIELKAS